MLLVGSNSLSSTSVSVFGSSKQFGLVTMQAWLTWTAMGATSFSCEGAKTFAWASARTFTMSNASSSTGAKIPGVSARAPASIVPASGNVTVVAEMPA